MIPLLYGQWVSKRLRHSFVVNCYSTCTLIAVSEINTIVDWCKLWYKNEQI